MHTLKQSGLTLIEMMLVVVVIALATLSGVKIIKNRATAAVVNTTVAQMQNAGQGVMAYFLINQKWPGTDLTSLTNTATGGVAYFSMQTLCSPFPGQNSSSTCKNYALIQGQPTGNDNYYNLTLQTNSADIANAIAAKLANAQSNGNLLTMTVQAPVSYFYENPNQGWVVSAGVISTYSELGANDKSNTGNNLSKGTPIVLPNCPIGFEGHYILSPQRYQTSEQWGINMSVTNWGSSGDHTDVSPSKYADDKEDYNKTFVYLNLASQGGGDNYGNNVYTAQIADFPNTRSGEGSTDSTAHQAFYMTFCLPLHHWYGNFTDTSTSTTVDGQCTTSWKNFLTYNGNSSISCNIRSSNDSSYYNPNTSNATTGNANAY